MSRTATATTYRFIRSSYKYRFVAMSQSDYKDRHQRMSVGAQIMEFCASNRITRYEFAMYANKYAENYSGVKITLADIYNYTSGRCSPKIDKLVVLCNAMHIPLDVMTGYHPIKDYKYHGFTAKAKKKAA